VSEKDPLVACARRLRDVERELDELRAVARYRDSIDTYRAFREKHPYANAIDAALAAAYEQGREDENRACEDIVRPKPGPEPLDFNMHRALQRQRRRLSAAIAARRTAEEDNDGQ